MEFQRARRVQMAGASAPPILPKSPGVSASCATHQIGRSSASAGGPISAARFVGALARSFGYGLRGPSSRIGSS